MEDTLATIGDTLTTEQVAELEQVSAEAGADIINHIAGTAEARNDVESNMPEVPKRKSGRRSRKGPLTRAEISEAVNDEQATIENFTSTAFTEGISALVDACLEDGANQVVLGQFVENWKVAPYDVQIAILESLPGGLAPELAEDIAKSNKYDEKGEIIGSNPDYKRIIQGGALTLYYLAFALFATTHDDLLEEPPAGQKQRLGEKRLSNWGSAYRADRREKLESKAQVTSKAELDAFKKMLEENAISVPESVIKAFEAEKTGAVEDKKATKAKPDQMKSVPKILNALWLHAAQNLNSEEQVTFVRGWLTATLATICTGFEQYDVATIESILRKGKA